MQYIFQFNWSNDGTTWIDESASVRTCRIAVGMPTEQTPPNSPQATVAAIGTCALTLENFSRRFSPDYASSPLFGNIVPRRGVRVQASDGVTTWTLFRGWIDSFAPDMGSYGQRLITVTAVDSIALLAAERISLPLQSNRRADQLIASAVNVTFNAPSASGTITLIGVPADGNTITIAGKAYTFKTTLTPTAGEVLIGADLTIGTAAQNLIDAINAGSGYGVRYAAGTARSEEVTATRSGGVITLTACTLGALGNSITLAKTGANITISGATLSNGADRPTGMINYQQGATICDLAADRWNSTTTSALDAIREAAASEFGRFFCARDGVLTFLDREWFFKPITPALSLNSAPFRAESQRGVDRIFNAVNVTVYPRATESALGVVASATTSLHLPPTSGSTPGTRRVTLTFRDSNGNPCGATALSLPLTPGTDYTVNERRDGSGVDYTTQPSFSIGTPDVRGSQITFTLSNAASGDLWVNLLQVRGKAILTYDPLTQSREDATSRASYQRRPLTIDLPLTANSVFAASLVDYLLTRHAAPLTTLPRLTIRDQAVINGVNVFSLNLFDTLAVTDPQTGLTNALFRITRIETEISAGRFALTFHTEPADPAAYWNLGITGYGELGTATRVAV